MSRKYILLFVLASIIGFAQEKLAMKEPERGWDRGAIPIVSAGLQDEVAADQLTAVPFNPIAGNSSAAFPYKERVVEFELGNAQSLDKIVLVLDRFNKGRPEMEVDMAGAKVYVSNDGQAFSHVPSDVSIQYYEQGGTLFAMVSLTGAFTGKYFRVGTAWKHDFYVYRFNGITANVKAFSKFRGQKMNLPLTATGNLTVSIKLPEAREGRAQLYVADKLLWQQALSEVPEETSILSPSVSLDGFQKGPLPVRLEFSDKADNACATLMGKVMYDPERTELKPEADENWGVVKIGQEASKMDMLKANTAGANIRYKVHASGKYALYVTVRGTRSFLVSVNGQTHRSSLQAMQQTYPRENMDATTGENFEGLYELKAQDELVISAGEVGTEVGAVSLSPVTDEDYRAFSEKSDVIPRVICHSDGYSDFYMREVTQEHLEKLVESMKSNNAFAFDWCVGTSSVNYPSKIASIFGTQAGVEFARNGDRMATERLLKLMRDSGSDPIAILQKKCSDSGVRLSVTIRPNAWYGSDNYNLNAQYLTDHPEWFMTNEKGGVYHKPSYAFKGVRDFYLTIIKEVAAYHPNAITIEFLRHPPYFMYDAPLVELYTRKYGQCSPENYLDEKWLKIQAEVMTSWLREIRQALDEIHPDIDLEINFDWKKYYRQGIDVEEILKEGLVDMISPGYYDVGYDKYFPLKPFVEMAKKSPKKVRIFPRIEATIVGHDQTPEEEKGLVKAESCYVTKYRFAALWNDFRTEGADGLRPFNGGSAESARMLSDETYMRNFMKYIRPLLDIRENIW